MLKYPKGAYFHEYLSLQHVFLICRMRISHMLSDHILVKNNEFLKNNENYKCQYSSYQRQG